MSQTGWQRLGPSPIQQPKEVSTAKSLLGRAKPYIAGTPPPPFFFYHLVLQESYFVVPRAGHVSSYKN